MITFEEINKKKRHGDPTRIAELVNIIAKERGEREYAEVTVRQQLNGGRTLKPIVREAAERYYKLFK